MTLPYRKKLIEVALPLEAINVASAREKSIRHGHPSTLHLWWARRPLAACRAVLFASLVDDPDSDPAFDAYKKSEDREHATGAKRQQLFDLITELVQWDNSNNELVINAARAEIARCVASRKIETGEVKKDLKLKGGETVWDLVVKGHGDLEQLRLGKARLPKAESVNAFLAEHAPPVLDPFAGGGSIPLEAQRLGLRAYASDLNPVPVLINKALIEIPPKFANMPPANPDSRHESGPPGKKNNGSGKALIEGGWKGAQGLAEDVRYYGKWMRDEAEKRIGYLYPRIRITKEMAKERPDLREFIGDDVAVIAWLWARTVASPNPVVDGAHVPLIRSFWLSQKEGDEAWVDPEVDKKAATYRFTVRTGKPPQGHDPGKSTIGRKGGTCLLTDSPMPLNHVRAEGRSGRMKARLMATVAELDGKRFYLSPTLQDEELAQSAPKTWRPDAEMPKKHRDIHPPGYGLETMGHLFTTRQLAAINCFIEQLEIVHKRIRAEIRTIGHPGGDQYADAIITYLSFAIGKGADYWSSIATWESGGGFVRSTFPKPGIAMSWDFCEVNPLGQYSGNWNGAIEWIVRVLQNLAIGSPGQVVQRDAMRCDEISEDVVFSTDPPYYDNIAYSELSDFFYVWLRRALSPLKLEPFTTLLTPKEQELIAAHHRHGGDKSAAQSFFERGLGACFGAMRNRQAKEFPLTVFYAFKQAETEDEDDTEKTQSTGWETMLEGMNAAGFSVLGTWPIRTERVSRSIGIGKNALASSIVLVCRSRLESASLATRREFLNALKRELPDALIHLQRGNIAPVDLAQAAIGPGMAVFTRYAKVMEADGTPMKVRQALALINQTLDEVLAEQEGEFDSDTRWALAWFEQFGMEEGAFGIAETLSKAKNTAINGLVEAGLIKAKGGKVRLLKRDELPEDWDPATDTRLRHWEIVQHLIRTLDKSGEAAAAALLRKLGGMGEMARDLAYRLYSICERKKWASEALAYNTLVIAWPEITKLAQSAPKAAAGKEEGLF